MRKSFVFSLLLILVTLHSRAQQIPVDTLVARFDKYRSTTLTEKIYAHVDRKFYVTGETLWFKLYNVDGSFHRPLDVSKVAYAEILGSNGEAVLQAKIELQAGLGSGSFFLPASLVTGNYTFRVYTNWMKNFPPAFYFHEVISIVNPFLTPDRVVNKASSACEVQFFPEGGNLVTGIPTRIAFSVTNRAGTPATCSGFVETSTGERVADFAPGASGLGSLVLTAENGKKYRAVLTDASGARHMREFPDPHPSGYAMSLSDSSTLLRITVRTKNVPDQSVYLFAHSRHIIAYARLQSLHNNTTTFVVSKEDLPEGITHFTVFSESLQPVCERLFFTKPRHTLDIKISASHKVIAPRRKLTVSLQTDNKLRTHLSMAVYKADTLTADARPGISAYLWLTSDLAELVTSRYDYLTGDDARADELMLTHGWRRFDWKGVLGQRPALKFRPEVREHIVTTVITQNGAPQGSVFTSLGSPGKIIRAYGAWTNPNGEALFEIKDFFGPRRIIVQAHASADQTYDIQILNPFSNRIAARKLPELVIADGMKGALQARSIAMQVQDIYYYDEFGTRTEVPLVDSTAFYGKADNTYFLDDYTRFPLMEEVMREYVPGVFVRKRKDGFHFVVVDYVSGGILPGDPMVLLDGVPVPDVDNMMRVDPLRVRKLEVVKRAYHLGQSVFSGIVSYTTYHGDLGGLELDPRSISLDYEGLQLQRIFHKPEYNLQQRNDRLPDQRFLLHWEPYITTRAGETSQVEFFTSDVPGDYLVVVEGLTDDGVPGSATYTVKVVESETP